MAIYDDVLRATALLNNIEWTGPESEDLAASLRDLRPYVKDLRRAYASAYPEVKYELRTCEAYLFAYYPGYVRMFYNVLRDLNYREFAGGVREELRACVLGAGPAPEAAAIHRYIAEEMRSTTRLSFHVIDRYSDGWKPVRDVAFAEVAKSYGPCSLGQESMTADLRDRSAVDRLEDLVGGLDLVVAQNVLNEIEDGWRQFLETLRLIAQWMAPGAVLIVADQGKHATSNERLREAELAVSGSMKILRSAGLWVTDYKLDKIKIPPVVSTHLLDGTDLLMPRRNISVNYFAGSRREYAGSWHHA